MNTIIMDGFKFTKTMGRNYYYNSHLRKHLHQYIYEKEYGEVPKGYEVHHKDTDTENNDIKNLIALSSEEHRKIHSENITKDERDRRRINVVKNAMPKAKEWHKSKEGLEWHKKHYEQLGDNMHVLTTKVCACCGKKYETTCMWDNKFCSNKCKSQYRRDSGVDNVTRNCIICGENFTCGKYSKAKTCSKKCASKSMVLSRQRLKQR